MELNDNAVVCTDSINPQMGEGSVGEIELYDELIAFAELPTEGQVRVESGPEPSSEPLERSADNAHECTLSEPVRTGAPVESLTFVSEAEEEQSSPEQVLPSVAMALAESETTVSETSSLPSEQDGNCSSEEGLLTAEKFETAEAEPADAETQSISSEAVEQSASSDWTLTGSPTQSVESVTAVPAAEPGCDSEVLSEPVDRIDAGPSAVDRPNPSGPLSGFNLPQEIVYTGALSRGVCLACGAESGADDLFCLACGDFVDEVGSTLPSNRICIECKERIDAEEIFCPWCGSAMQAQR